jgi:hypothetical protein
VTSKGDGILAAMLAWIFRSRRARGVCAAASFVVFGCGVTSAHAASPPPTVAIVTPAASATVKGTVAVTAQATAGSGDTLSSIYVYDGANTIGSGSCQSQPTCTITVNWRATGLSGPHTLEAHATGNSGGTATSADVVVTVQTPAPTAVITQPAAGSVLKGTLMVAASAATDPALDDYPTSITVYDGVNSIGTISCQGQTTCAGTVKWSATGLTGAHNLLAKVFTRRDVSAVSPGVGVTLVTPPPTVTITKPKAGARLGGKITLAASAATDPALDDYPTGITFFDGSNRIGSIDCQGQQTCAGSLVWDTAGLKGRHSVKAVVSTRQDESATSAAVTVGQASRVSSKPSCRLSAHRVKVRRRVRGVCTVPGVASGTRVAVKYRTGRSYATVVNTKVAAGGFHFSLKGSRRATFRLVVVVAANGRYRKTTVSIGTLTIVR